MVVDFMLNIWWYPVLVEPTLHALIRGCRAEPEFINNIYTVLKILNAIFHGQALDENSSQLEVNTKDYIERKK